MPVPELKEACSGRINEVVIGSAPDHGGTRSRSITVGGAQTLPGLDFDGDVGRRPAIAMDVLDVLPEDWPGALRDALGSALHSPADWASRCVDEFGAELICIKLDGIDPDAAGHSAGQAVDAVLSVLKAVPVPLIIWGCENAEADGTVLPKVSQAVRGERCLIGPATESNYKVLAATCLADGHSLITSAPLDINIARQVNILVSDMNFPLDRIVMYQTTGALGYGLEYAYSIQERQRLAALGGDRMMSMPVICDVGTEAWRAKEAKAADHPDAGWMWELITATTLLQSGVDIFRMRHPKAAERLRMAIADIVRDDV